MKINYSQEVQAALDGCKPILALESTIIAHGMPYPKNLEFAQQAESLCKNQGVVPATVAIINGQVYVGLQKSCARRGETLVFQVRAVQQPPKILQKNDKTYSKVN